MMNMGKNDWRKKEIPILSIFGLVLLLIGLVASFYVEHPYPYASEYPYKDIGLVLALAGIMVTTLGFIPALLRR